MGGPSPAADLDLRLDRLTGILQYEPRDLTISVAAGTPWRELTATLAAAGQMLPLDPPCAAAATVGGVVATNGSGPRRRLHGSVRDAVIGMSVATLDGRLIRAGGMVVKNVAGLDVQKALIGSFGTLAAIASVNFKLAPLPPLSRTFLSTFDAAGACLAARDRVLQSVLQPSAIDILNPAAARLAGFDGYVLAVRAGGSAAVLARYARELDGAQPLDGPAEAGFWETVQEFAPRWTSAGPQRSVVRAGHALGELGGVLESAPGPCVARAGNGVAYLAFDSVEALRLWLQSTSSAPWSRLVEWSGDAVRGAVELWPAEPADFALMRQLKQLFDPRGLLNPGRLYGRL
jgi:glycolate oxidase FAD binding subunit